MKTKSINKSGLKHVILLLVLLGFSITAIFAQDGKMPKDNKKEEKVIRYKVIAKDQNGKVSKIDTIYKNEGGKMDMKDLEQKLKEMEITLNIEMDSLDSLTKEVTAVIDMDEMDMPNGMSCNPLVVRMHEQGGQQGWMQGYTPWGKIRNIKVKDKKHGKKIVIRTEDMDMYDFMMMAPPVPPPPPIPPMPPKEHKAVKKIIIEKDKKE